MLEVRFVLLASMALATPTTTLAQDWQTGTGGNSARTGFVACVGPSAPTPLWEGSVPAEMAQSAVIDGDVLVAARSTLINAPFLGSWIVAHDLRTGELLWQRELPVDFAVSDWHSRVSAIRDGLVFATRSGDTNAAYLYALRVSDGAIVWRSEGQVDETSAENLAFTSNGDLIVGNFWSVMRIRASDGATMWEKPRYSPSSDAGYAAVHNDRVYTWEATRNGPCVVVFDAATGTRLYSSAGIGGGFFQQIGLMVGPDGTVYAPRAQDNAHTDYFVALEDTGSALVERWRVPLAYAPFASFGVGPDGSVYSYSRAMEVIRINPSTGEVINRSLPLEGDAFRPRMAIDANGTLFVTNGGFDQGRLYSFNADLTERWSIPAADVGASGPALSASGMLVLAGTGTDFRVFASEGTECRADWNGDQRVNTQDLFEFLAAFFEENADFNGDGRTDSLDVFAFLEPYLSGC